MNIFKRFQKEKSGNFAVLSGILALPLFMVGGIVMDYSIINRTEKALQNAADASALGSAKELTLVSTADSTVKQVVKDFVYSNLTKDIGIDGGTGKLEIKTTISKDRKDVTVDLAYYWKPFLTQYISSDILPLRVSSTATLVGGQTICVIALDETSDFSLSMSGISTMNANDCAIYSNSGSPVGISTVKGSVLSASETYTGGGYQGPVSTYIPKPVTDSPIIDDPLRDRERPKADIQCDEKDLKITSGLAKLEPGTYCGGISIRGKSKVMLESGIYIMKDGPLSVGGNGTIEGDNVGFVFEGEASVFDFGVSTQVNISAPKSGLMAGILFFEDRASSVGRNFVIRSKDAERFEGTVYLSNGKLIVDKKSRVGQLSRWTAIVARNIEIKQGPNLQINANYGQSDIPVPEGIGPTGTEPRLSR